MDKPFTPHMGFDLGLTIVTGGPRTIHKIGYRDQLDRVLARVQSALAGEVEGDPAVGRYPLDTFAASTEGLGKGGFNASLQVI